MNFLRSIGMGVLLAVAATASHAQIYFQDNSAYVFNGNSSPINQPVNGFAYGPPPTFWWVFPAAAPANVPLTLSMTMTSLTSGANTQGMYLYFMDTLSGQVTTASLDSLGAQYNFRNGIYTLTLTPNGSTALALFGAQVWNSAYSVIISDVCIFGPGGCSNGPSGTDTTAALQLLAASLKTPLVINRATAENALVYDCDRFDARNLCFTAIGRRLSGNSLDYSENAGAIMLVYRLSPQWRVGGYADQGTSTSTANLRVAADMPLVGINAIWNARPDGEGLEVRGGVAMRQQSLDVTRVAVGSSEAGTGRTQISSKLASVTAYYNRRVSDAWAVAPYAGVRYYHGQISAYTEAISGSVTAPLTYADLSEQTVTASLGLRATGQFGKTTVSGAAGLDRNLTSGFDSLSASGVSGISPVTLNDYQQFKTRVVASASVTRDLGERQSVGLTALYRQEAFRGTTTTALFAQYRVGF